MPTVNDVTQLNPIPVFSTATPTTTQEVVDILVQTQLPVSVGGGHFSMGGQTASPGTLHIDLRQMNRVLRFEPEAALIRVQAGIRWCDIQRFVDPHGLAVKIMQTYANFTVGGALSVNAHGRYIGLGPMIMSVRSIVLVLPNGDVVEASHTQNMQLFDAAIGGYGGIGIIVEAELELVPNTRLERSYAKMSLTEYGSWFDANVRDHPDVVFHNFDLYPPRYARGRAVSWTITDRRATAPRLQPLKRGFWLPKYLLWAITETPLGKFRREFLYDPLIYLKKPVHWRNYEAGYDVAELEPLSRYDRTYVLQEYFVPAGSVSQFAKAMGTVLSRHRVNVVNISIRHALADDWTIMAWARGETFAFVLYYKQRTENIAKEQVAVWTRALIDAVLEVGGTYYLDCPGNRKHFQPMAWGPGIVRKWERRYALTSEYLVKAAYGKLIGIATHAAYDLALMTTDVVVDRWNGHTTLPGNITLIKPLPGGRALLALPRYFDFRIAATTLAQEGIHITDIAGNTSTILVSVWMPNDKPLPRGSWRPLFQQSITMPEHTRRVALLVPVSELSAFLLDAPAMGMTVEHVYDY